MKKLFTLFAAAAMVASASAGTRVLYAQDFEGVTSGPEAGWSFAGTSMTIYNDGYSNLLQLVNSTNGRSGQGVWGTDIYGENGDLLEDGIYTVSFDFNVEVPSNNQYNNGITLLSNLTPPDNQPFTGRWTLLKDQEGNDVSDMSLYQGYLFDLMQVQRFNDEGGNAEGSYSSIQYKVNGDENDLIVLETSSWYTFTFVVDVNNRTVEYSIEDVAGPMVTSGVREVPLTECDGTEISMYASSLWVMVARYATTLNFDNIKISCESSVDVANTPSVALTGLGVNAEGEGDLNYRAYTINWIEGELLHIIGTDGEEITPSYADWDGIYVYETTTSGTLSVWTTCGSATSEVVEVYVDTTPVALPEASVEIVSVEEGYGKTYRLVVSNADVPMVPTIFISYNYVCESGDVLTAEELGTGALLTVPEAGTLTVTTAAFGYQSTTTSIVNDIPYAKKYTMDFARLTPGEITNAGFASIDDLNSGATSGENNWTARKRLFYYDINTATVDEESGETVYTAVYPFGYVADDSECVMHRWQIPADDMTEEKADSIFDGITLWNGLAAQIQQGVGLIQNATSNNYNTVKVRDCGAEDIVIFNTINSYGSNSIHPIVATADEYFAQLKGEDYAVAVNKAGEEVLTRSQAGAYRIPQEDGKYTVGFQLYRIDTALVYVEVYGAAGESAIIDITNDLNNIDNAWYTIDGIRLQAPAQSGLYIHNGKKVIIRK